VQNDRKDSPEFLSVVGHRSRIISNSTKVQLLILHDIMNIQLGTSNFSPTGAVIAGFIVLSCDGQNGPK
jgi:hypothetical protein